ISPILSFLFIFFFSSRRRHTRFSRDWSSDVCSSDLQQASRWRERLERGPLAAGSGSRALPSRSEPERQGNGRRHQNHERNVAIKIGRASCRERVKKVGLPTQLNEVVIAIVKIEQTDH